MESEEEIAALPLGPGDGERLRLPPRRRLLTGVRTIDRFLGGFPPGQVTLMRGLHHAPTLLPRLLVLAVLELDEDVVLVDGGNVANPFLLSAVCRRLRVRPREVLPRVHIARAFTSFQMSSILEDSLPSAIMEHAPGALAVTCVDELYHDDNVGRDQATVLLGRALDRLRGVTETHGLVALLADLRPGPRRRGGRFSALLDDRAHEVVTLERRSRRSLRVRRRDGATATVASPPPGQLTLDDFRVGGITDGWEATAASPREAEGARGMAMAGLAGEGAAPSAGRWHLG